MKKERNWKKWQRWNNLWEIFCQKGFLWSLGVGDVRNFVLQMTALVGTSQKMMGWIHKFLLAGGQAASPYPRSQALVLLPLEAASKPRVCDKGRLGPVEQHKFFSETGKAALGPDLVTMIVAPHPSPHSSVLTKAGSTATPVISWGFLFGLSCEDVLLIFSWFASPQF